MSTALGRVGPSSLPAMITGNEVTAISGIGGAIVGAAIAWVAGWQAQRGQDNAGPILSRWTRLRSRSSRPGMRRGAGGDHVSAEVRGDELLVSIDVAELPDRADARSLAAKLPANVSGIATEVVKMLAAPQAAREPAAVRPVTVQLVRTRVVAAETLMLDRETQVYPRAAGRILRVAAGAVSSLSHSCSACASASMSTYSSDRCSRTHRTWSCRMAKRNVAQGTTTATTVATSAANSATQVPASMATNRMGVGGEQDSRFDRERAYIWARPPRT